MVPRLSNILTAPWLGEPIRSFAVAEIILIVGQVIDDKR